MKIVVRDQRNGSWYWISRAVYQEYASEIGAIGLALYNAYASYAFDKQKVFPSQTTIAKKLCIGRQTLIKYNKILIKQGLISTDKQDGKVNIIILLRVEPVRQMDRGVREVDRGCTTDGQVPVREVDTNKKNTNKKKLTRRINNVFEHWNLYKNQGNWKSHREVTPEIVEAINERLKKYSIEQLKAAITNYADILLSPQFVWSKNWTLREFLTRHRPDDRNELQLYRFLENNFSPDDFKRTDKFSIHQKKDRSHIRQANEKKILEADHDKLIAVRQDVHHKDKAFLIDELRPEIIAEILAERKTE